jgi:catechol 2,3-dioxygenase-like lactoylglutathione lyase family enzyme
VPSGGAHNLAPEPLPEGELIVTFITALRSAGPDPKLAGKMALYGWLVGNWSMDATIYGDDGTQHASQGTIHCSWVLNGRAIQDVWILPGFFHGTTLRIYDPGLDAWHILWSDPLKQYYTRQIGRADGQGIVQEGRNDLGERTRWSFSDITENSFRWTGERSPDDGTTWQLQAQFQVQRTAFPEPRPMLDHVSIGVRDLPASKRFYDAALGGLDYVCLSDGPEALGYGAPHADADSAFWIYQTERPVPADRKSGLHFCFSAPSRAAVDAFHAAALRTGGSDNGPPGLRADYGPSYYAAFAIDPDGYRVEAHYHG